MTVSLPDAAVRDRTAPRKAGTVRSFAPAAWTTDCPGRTTSPLARADQAEYSRGAGAPLPPSDSSSWAEALPEKARSASGRSVL